MEVILFLTHSRMIVRKHYLLEIQILMEQGIVNPATHDIDGFPIEGLSPPEIEEIKDSIGVRALEIF